MAAIGETRYLETSLSSLDPHRPERNKRFRAPLPAPEACVSSPYRIAIVR